MGAARPWQPLAGAVVGALGLACLLRRPASSAGGALRLEAAAPLRFGARGAYEKTAGVGYPYDEDPMFLLYGGLAFASKLKFGDRAVGADPETLFHVALRRRPGSLGDFGRGTHDSTA